MRRIIYKGDKFVDYSKYYDPTQINVVIGPRMTGKTFSFYINNPDTHNVQIYGKGDDVKGIKLNGYNNIKQNFDYTFSKGGFYVLKRGTVIECNNSSQFYALLRKYNIILEECEHEEPITIK